MTGKVLQLLGIHCKTLAKTNDGNDIAAAGIILETQVKATGTNTAAIATITATIGISSVAGNTPSTGL